MDIWQLAKQRLADNQEKALQIDGADDGPVNESRRRHESVVIVCGSKDAGKSTFIQRFLERSEAPKPTVAMEYTYGRRTRANNKDVAHIWELGGGSSMAELLAVPITEKNIEITSLLLFLDPTSPQTMWTTLETLLAVARAKTEGVIKQLNRSSPHIHDRIVAASKQRMAGHKDASMCQPFPIPLAIVAGKYDLFQNLDSDVRRHICATLRFVAHYYGAALMMTSSRMEQLSTRGRALLSHLAFGTANSKGLAVDHNKPLFVPVGADSFEDIGMPPVSSDSFSSLRASQPIHLWKEAFIEAFPQKEHKLDSEDPSADPLFREPLIDTLIEQKSKDLEMYVKQKRDRQAVEERAAKNK